MATEADAKYSFEGWVAHDPSSIDGKMRWEPYEPKPFEDADVDVEITHCGVCSSDLAHLRSGWRPADYPMVVGHELVGRVVRAGPGAAREYGLQLGDRVGVGAQCKSCLRADCGPCSRGLEQHCGNDFVTTFDARFRDGTKAYGGYARYWRGPAAFAFRIPDGLASEAAAPMLCAGLTVYSPLVEHGAGPGKRVGVVGIGGLGHFALQFAKALGCDRVVAISRSSSKKADALAMGADDFIATAEDGPDWHSRPGRAGSLDLVISTVSGAGFEMERYLALLDVRGALVQVGAPDDPMPGFNAWSILRRGLTITGSLIGSRQQARDMLEWAAGAGIKPWVQVRPMSEANEAVRDMAATGARYRFVLENK